MNRQYSFSFLSLVFLLSVAFVLDIATGSIYIPPTSVLAIIFGKTCLNEGWRLIVFVFRLPKALCAVTAGAGLAVSGLMMQTLFRNPLAGPSVLGITSGASLGVALVVLGTSSFMKRASFLSGLGIGGNVMLISASAIGAGMVLFIILLLARYVEDVMTILIVGILGSFAIGSVVSVLIHFSRPEMVQAYLAWTFGNFGSVTWAQLRIFIPICVVLLLLSIPLAKPLNGLLLGEAYARSMGINHERLRLAILVLTALMVGDITAFCGTVGFIGIAVPHLARAIIHTSDHRLLLPATALAGGITALITDTVAQLPGQQAVLPLNAVTAIIGAPVIIWFILGNKSKGTR